MNPKPPERPTREPPPEWLERAVRLLDDHFRLPGTSFRFGLDGLLGLLLPVVGDAASVATALGVFWLALKRGLPRVVIARMALNVALDAIVGAIPFVGDAFDFVWKANRRNLQLVERYAHAQAPRRARLGDYLLIGFIGLVLICALALPFVVAGLVVRWIVR